MCSRPARIALFALTCLLVGNLAAYPQADSFTSCPSSAKDDHQKARDPEISIAEVSFWGPLAVPISDQEQISDSVKRDTHGTSLEGITDEAIERVRAGWQNLGYFNVQVTAEAKTLTRSPVDQRIAISVHVDAGQQYNLKGIRFKNNKAISSVDILRGLFPIADGEVFSREKIANGLENLHKAYGELGYINFTSVPNAQLNDQNGSISLAIDVDEGKQFRIGRVDVLGIEEPLREELLKTFPVGRIYTSSLLEESLSKYADMFPHCDCSDRNERRLDEKSGTVLLTLDFRPCTAEP
jgi:outer membrane protein assembly factor BamA